MVSLQRKKSAKQFLTGSVISISRLFISREPVIFSFPVVLDDQVSLSCSAVDFDNNLRYCGNLLAFLFWKSLASLCEILKLSIRAGALHGLQRLHLKRSLNLTSQTYNYASNRHALIYFDYHLHSLNIRTSKSGCHYLRFMLKRLDKVIFQKLSHQPHVHPCTTDSPLCFYHISCLTLFS